MGARKRPGAPLLYRLVRDNTGQTETLGVVLLLGIAVAGTAAVVAFGSAALNNTKEASQLQRSEHAMTLFDSRTAMVALGSSDAQQVDFAGGGNGNYSVKPDAGRMTIVHYNYEGNDQQEVIYNGTLGAMVYENGDTEIAYQGGGVWRKGKDSQEMVSPPEFHYRAATLTLPVIKVRGDGSASGSVTATVTATQQANRIFPDGTNDSAKDGPAHFGAPYNDTDGDGDEEPTTPYTNPVQNGSVWVYVQSEYYEAWGEYFRTRSDGNVKVWDGNQTAGIELISGGKVGFFQMPTNNNGVQVNGVNDAHTIRKFAINLSADKFDSANFANLQWGMSAQKGNMQYEVKFYDGKKACKGGGSTEHADVYIYFDRDDSDSEYQGWHVDDGAKITCQDMDNDGNDENYLQFNLTGSTVVTYESISSAGVQGNLNEFSTSGESLKTGGFNWGDHSADSSISTISTGTTLAVNTTTNHYFALFAPSFDLVVRDKNSNTVHEETSNGYLTYGGDAKIFLTYLHITENEVEVDF